MVLSLLSGENIMYENYTRQAVPSRKYRELLGTAICVFNSNNAFVIENILRSDDNGQYDWYSLIDRESGKLKEPIQNTIAKKTNEKIGELFSEVVTMRNRIIHSFQITYDGQQILATKTRIKEGNQQFIISEEYLLKFIKKNEELSSVLYRL